MKLIKFSLMLSISLLPLYMQAMEEKKVIKSEKPRVGKELRKAKKSAYAALATYSNLARIYDPEDKMQYREQGKEYAEQLNHATTESDYKRFTTTVQAAYLDLEYKN